MHLCIRDFFIFTALKQADSLLTEGGIQGKPIEWRNNADHFEQWCRGDTGLPFVDACMRELAATGYMSNRGRQNVASFLAKGLQHDWRFGAQVRTHVCAVVSCAAECKAYACVQPDAPCALVLTCS